MKHIIILFFTLLIGRCVLAQVVNPKMITTRNMGPFMLDARSTDIEKITGQKLPLSAGSSADYGADTLLVNYNKAEYKMIFQKIYVEKIKAFSGWQLKTVSSENAGYKTKSGEGIGDTMTKMSLHGNKEIVPVNVGNGKQILTLFDGETDTSLSLETLNNKIIKIIVSYTPGD